jgi:hypothetical protein
MHLPTGAHVAHPYHFVLVMAGANEDRHVEARSRIAAYNRLMRDLNDTGMLAHVECIQLICEN